METALINSEFPFIPGGNKVLYLKGKGTEFYCLTCKQQIQPIWVRRGNAVFAACNLCFYDDLPLANAKNGGEIGDLEEDKTTPVAA